MTTLDSFRATSREEIAESISVAGNQGKVSRSLINVTPAHRHLARRQFLVQQIAYWITVLGLLVAEASAPILGAETMWIWLAVSIGTWAVRLLLFMPLSKLPPAVVKKSLVLKLIPLAIISIACAYWIWTISLFAGPALTVRELFMCIGLLSISVSMTGMWPVTPIAVIIYNGVLWGSFSASLYITGLATLPVIFAFDTGVLVVLWLNTFIAVNQIKDQLERSREMGHLVEKLEAANGELARLRDSAYKTLSNRSESFSQASHDLHQRLHGTKQWVLSAMDAHKAGKPVNVLLDRVGQEIDAFQIFMNDVLDVTRPESVDTEIKPSIRATDIQSLFQKLDLQFEKIAATNGKHLRFRLTDISIGSDAKMLSRILENLVANALKYSRSGVLVCARRNRQGVAIDIWDQGPGIKPEAQQRIFDAFHHEVVDDVVRQRGSGLGLAIVRRYAGRLNYKILVTSQVGRGSRFRVQIPSEFVRSSDQPPPKTRHSESALA